MSHNDWYDDAELFPISTEQVEGLEKCIICETTENVNAHHALYKSTYPRFKHRKANLVPLCQKHHQAIHDGNKDFEIRALRWALSRCLKQLKKELLEDQNQVKEEELFRHTHLKCPFKDERPISDGRDCLWCKVLHIEDKVDSITQSD